MIDDPLDHEYSAAERALVVRGELDEGATTRLRQVIGEHSADLTEPLTVVLTDVELLPSAAVGVLAKAQEDARAGGTELSLVAADGTIAQRVLRISGVSYQGS